jgi:mycothiol synthase
VGRPDAAVYVAQEPGSGNLQGVAAAWRVWLDKFRVEGTVALAMRRRGVGSALLAGVIEHATARGGATLQARVRVDEHAERAFLERRGFAESQRLYPMTLALADAPSPPVAPDERWDAAGVRFTTLEAARRTNPEWLRWLLDLENAVLPTWPEPDPGPIAPLTLEEFRPRLASRDRLPEAYFLAEADGAYVGYACLDRVDGEGAVLWAAGTAVHPAHRGRGLAQTLKARTVAFARSAGAREIRTGSASPAMLAVNERFGFRRGLPEIRLLLRLPGAGSTGRAR